MDTLEERILDLALGRAIKAAYGRLSADKQQEMQKVFSQDSPSRDKADFFRKNIADFDKIFEAEAQKLQQEIFEEIEKRV